MRRTKAEMPKEPEQPSSKVEVVYAGGTISSMMTAGGYLEGGHKVDLVDMLNQNDAHSIDGITITGSDFAYLGLSENMDYGYWAQIEAKVSVALSRQPDAVLLTHGTDSLEQTARYLQEKFLPELEARRSVIVITAANRDIAHPETDAWDNLRFALASAKRTLEPGVYVAFHGVLIPAEEVVKEPFDGVEMNYTSRQSQRYEALQQLHAEKNAQHIVELRAAMAGDAHSEKVIDYPVNVVVENHDSFLASLTEDTKAVLLTLYHSGTANTENAESSVADLIKELRQQGIVVFGATENGEAVDLHLYETSVKLRQAGVVPLYDMSKTVALEKLAHVAELPADEMIDLMLTNVVGEITQPLFTEDIEALKALYQSGL